MSASKDELLDLEQAFLPAWAKQPSTENRYADYKGGGDAGFDDRRGGRGDRRDRPPGRREPFREGGPRPQGQGFGRPPRGDRRDRPPRGAERPREDRRPAAPPPPPPLPEVNVALVPETLGVDSLARQIRMTGRAYPLFDVAQLILAKPERYTVTFSTRKNTEGAVVQPLYVCALDETVWLSQEEAVAWALDKHFNLFYQAERTQIEPPKGTYTFVAQCGMSGIVLGPPNHHDYQNRLSRLHQERFSRMPFEMFKARVRIVRDEAVVKKWIEEQSFKTEFTCLNVPEPLRLGSREEVEKHFREVHLPSIVKEVETHQISGPASRNLRCSGLYRLVRAVWEDQRRFPLQSATVLSQQFASRGLQFFKVNRTVTHVGVARPHYLDLDAGPISEGVKRIVEFINATAKCTRKKLLDGLAPVPAGVVPKAATPMVPVAPAEPAPAPAEPAPAAEAEVESATPAEASVGPAPAEAPVPATPPVVAPAEPRETPERTALLTDLHWLIHQGHVIEFANGVIETAKKPAIKPVKPAPEKPAAAGASIPTAEAASGAETATESQAAPVLTDEAVPAESAAPTEAGSNATDAISPPPVAELPADTAVPSTPTEPEKPAQT